MCYKIISNATRTQIASFPTFPPTNKTRGNSRKLDKSHVSTARDVHAFAKRIVNVWNSLLDCIVLFNSVVTFRYKVNKLHFSGYRDT